jgi:hypothetical protein
LDAEFLEQAIAQFDERGIAAVPRVFHVNASVEGYLTFNEHHRSIGQQDGFVDVVGHEQHGGAMTRTETLQERVHLDTGESVEGPKGLVQQHELRFSHERSSQRDALRLASRERERPIVGVLG